MVDVSDHSLLRRRFLELTGGLGAGLAGTDRAPSGEAGGVASQADERANPYAHQLVVRYHSDRLPSAQAVALQVAQSQNQRATIGVVREPLRFFKLHLDPDIDTDDRDRIRHQLGDGAPIEAVGVETTAKPDYRPIDPGYNNNWEDGDRKPRGPQNNVDVPAIGLESAWDRTKAESTEVAICDTGPVHRDHEDLQAQVARAENPLSNVRWEVTVTPAGERVYRYVNPPFDPSTPPVDHTTAIAGVTAATHNDVGIAGACQAAIRSVSPAMVGQDADALATDMLATVQYAIEQTHATVVNFSHTVRTLPQLVSDVCATADRNRTLIVVSSGNAQYGQRPGMMARQDETITVSRCRRNGIVDPNRSSTGPGIDVTAPGFQILTTTYSPGSTASYDDRGGSSLSAPLVAGIAALGLDYHPPLRTDMDQLRAHIKRTATPIPGMDQEKVGHGMINAARVLAEPPGQAGLQATTPTPPPTQQGGTPSIGREVGNRATVGAGVGGTDGTGTTVVASTRDDRGGPIDDEANRLLTTEQFETETAVFDAETTPWTPDEITQESVSAPDSDSG